VRTQIAALQANIEVAKAYLTQAVEQAKLRLEGTKSAADVYKAICASALGTIHASANLSGSENVGWSFGRSESTAMSYSESV
jgi:ATP/maltotriose-dependent transcriptional regulator MalT